MKNMKRIKFKEYVGIRKIPGSFIISSDPGGRDITIQDNENNKKLLELLKTQGIPSEEEINFPILNKFRSYKLLEDANRPKSSRSEMFFDYLNVNLTDNIRQKRILIFGAGGGGGSLIYLLAQQGFSNITCVDYDIVEESDIFKTSVYRRKDISNSKLDILQKCIKNNFHIRINCLKLNLKTSSDLHDVVSNIKPELIVYAIDPNPKLKLEINAISKKNKIPLIFMAYSFEKIICGPLIVPNITSCMEGYNKYLKLSTRNAMDLMTVEKIYTQNTIHPSMTFIINILASFIFKDIVMFLSDNLNKVSSLNSIIIYDTLTLEGVKYELSCDLCASCIFK